MRLQKQTLKRQSPGIPMAGMIDIVFLLLIFFLVTSTWLPMERQLNAGLALSRVGEQVAEDLEQTRIDLESVSSGVEFRFGARATGDLEQLSEWLAGYPFKEAEMLVVVHDQVRFEDVARLMAVCRQVGFDRVTYVPTPAASERSEGPE
jgi:biopolymer transport protein ExbD